MFRRRQPKLPQAVDEALQQIPALVRRIQDLEEGLAALQDKHERLRGRFYATKTPDEPPAPETKAEILRRMGFLGRK